jgi:signal peptidase I
MKRWLRENRGFVALLLVLALFRTAVADWNPIPSGSMRPTLLEGDVVFVDRLAYNLKLPLTNVVLARLHDPKRGDIVTFDSPKDGTRLIKRIVALPGDTVAMRGEVLIINGRLAHYASLERVREPLGDGRSTTALRLEEQTAAGGHRIQVLYGVHALDSFGPVTVPPDQYLMLGDNRDNSADSHYFGFVPRALLIGRAVGILVSADIKGDWLPRFDRFGRALD